MFEGEVFARSPMDRTIAGIAVKGSAAAADSEVELFVDEVRIGNYFNTGTGFPNGDDEIDLEDLGVPAGAQLRAVVRDAATTNPLFIRITLEQF